MSSTKIVQPSNRTIYPVLFIISACHLLNDSLQAVIPAMFPILEKSLGLTFTQLGLIAFSLNMVASVSQPVIGMVTDTRPMPFALPIGLISSMFGMLGLALAPSFPFILISVVFIGLGSATFHPEGSRVAYLAAGPRRGLSQSIFQVGGNTGQSLAPLITALVLVPLGQFGAIWFTLAAGMAVILLFYIAKWYQQQIIVVDENHQSKSPKTTIKQKKQIIPNKVINNTIFLLVIIVFARTWYHITILNFYAFYTMEQYGFSISKAQIYIFIFLFVGAVGTFFGGPISDRFGKKTVIILSFIVPIPFAILLPFVNAIFSFILLIIIGFFIMSSFSVTVVYAQELKPNKVGTMSGLIVGLAFGMGAIGSVVIGSLIDWISLTPTMIIVSFIPIIGLLSFLLPKDESVSKWYV